MVVAILETDRLRIEVGERSVGTSLIMSAIAGNDKGWVQILMSCPPPSPYPRTGNLLYDASIDPANRTLAATTMQSVEAGNQDAGGPGASLVLDGQSESMALRQTFTVKPGESRVHVRVDVELVGELPQFSMHRSGCQLSGIHRLRTTIQRRRTATSVGIAVRTRRLPPAICCSSGPRAKRCREFYRMLLRGCSLCSQRTWSSILTRSIGSERLNYESSITAGP